MTYQLTTGTTILRLNDNAFIPFDPVNTDYQAYLRWLEEGNEPLPATEDTEALASYITGSSYNTWPALTNAAGTEENNIETADMVQETPPRKRSASKRKQS